MGKKIDVNAFAIERFYNKNTLACELQKYSKIKGRYFKTINVNFFCQLLSISFKQKYTKIIKNRGYFFVFAQKNAACCIGGQDEIIKGG
jgi:hypothetical protein